MKKRIIKTALVSLALTGALALCGCGKLPFAQKTPDFNKTYTVSAEITYDKLKANADITRVTEDEWEVKFTEPQQLRGLTVNLNKDGCAASLNGFSVSAKNSSAYTSLPRLVTDGLTQLVKAQGSEISAKDGVLTYSGTLGGKSLTITVNETTGDLISLKCPYQKLSVNFSGQKPFALLIPEEGGAI